MKVCVLGSGGMLGHMLIRVLNDSHDVYGTTREKTSDSSPLARFMSADKWIGGVDAANLRSIKNIFELNQFDVVINCIGLIKQRSDQVDDRLMMSVNGEFPHQLAGIANQDGAKVIQISTDCVFSGFKGNYVETDTPDPVDVYGRSKLLGELTDDTNLTIRTSHIGRELSVKKSFMEWSISQRSRHVNGFGGAIYSGLTTKSLARIVGSLISDHSSLTGLFHIASEPISKYDLLCILNSKLRLNLSITPDDASICDRSLDGTRFLLTTGIEIPSWDQMLDEFVSDETTYKQLGFR